jgi:hypothetical protein
MILVSTFHGLKLLGSSELELINDEVPLDILVKFLGRKTLPAQDSATQKRRYTRFYLPAFELTILMFEFSKSIRSLDPAVSGLALKFCRIASLQIVLYLGSQEGTTN